MGERTCDSCGKKENLEGGKTCERGHFICNSCITKPIGIFSGSMRQCPLCKKELK